MTGPLDPDYVARRFQEIIADARPEPEIPWDHVRDFNAMGLHGQLAHLNAGHDVHVDILGRVDTDSLDGYHVGTHYTENIRREGADR